MEKVKIVETGDSEFRIGEKVMLDEFLANVKAILVNGGQMPVAILAGK